ncbi:MAG TPA: 4-(cytidine 5'-diphospho)-2-C-methyl-D-erythritol kinase [Chloroflexia bacterium]|nr:4-(cytidine 5'-diphospho)-2-C-methyl-D-erythritol kinase [Chloroflexia bacterium]
MIQRNAYAKINLCLEVISRRDDGYHDIISVMQRVDLYDTLTFTPADDLTVECDDPNLAVGEANLIWRAARLLQENAGVTSGARIELRKRIPTSAGLAGGSSDAAATLLGLCELWGLELSKGELRYLAAQLGSDVPFFLNGPTALVEGRGERVTHLPATLPGWAVLVCQPYDLPNKTQRLYAALKKQDMTDGNTTRQLVHTILREEFPRADLLHNSFQRAAFAIFGGLAQTAQLMLRSSGRDAHLSGSGPTLYTLFTAAQRSRAQALHDTLQAQGLNTYLTRLITTKP